MPSQAEVEAVLKAKAAGGKIKTEDVLAAVATLGVPADKVEAYLKEHKDAEKKVDLAAVTAFIASL